MYYEKQERELHLKDIIFAVLHQWRKIFVLALVFAVLLGGMKAVSVRKKSAQTVDLTAYYQQLEEYEQTKTVKEQEQEWIEERLTNHRAYMQESVLMNLDPTNLYRAAMDFYIADADELYAQRILEVYRSAINNADFIDQAAAELELESKYLRELLTVSTKSVTVGEKTRQQVGVAVNYKDLEGVTRLLELVNQQLDNTAGQVTDSLGSHTLMKIQGFVGKCVDNSGVAAAQWAEKERLTDYEDAVNKVQKSLKGLDVPVKPAAPNNSVVRSAVKFAVIGGLLGGVLGAVWALMTILFGDKLYSASDLQGRYNVKLLGTVAGGKKKSGLDRWLDAREGRITEDTAQNDALLAVSIRSRCADEVLLCGDAEAAKGLAGRLSNALAPVTVLETGDPVKEPDALECLQQAKSIALVAVCGKDRYSHMAKIMELMHDLNKEFIGCIVVEN